MSDCINNGDNTDEPEPVQLRRRGRVECGAREKVCPRWKGYLQTNDPLNIQGDAYGIL